MQQLNQTTEKQAHNKQSAEIKEHFLKTKTTMLRDNKRYCIHETRTRFS